MIRDCRQAEGKLISTYVRITNETRDNDPKYTQTFKRITIEPIGLSFGHELNYWTIEPYWGAAVWGIWMIAMKRFPLPYCLSRFMWLRLTWLKKDEHRKNVFQVGCGGSSVKPWEHCRVRIGRLCFGFESPKWLKAFKRAKNLRYWDKVEEEMARNGEPGFGNNPER